MTNAEKKAEALKAFRQLAASVANGLEISDGPVTPQVAGVLESAGKSKADLLTAAEKVRRRIWLAKIVAFTEADREAARVELERGASADLLAKVAETERAISEANNALQLLRVSARDIAGKIEVAEHTVRQNESKGFAIEPAEQRHIDSLKERLRTVRDRIEAIERDELPRLEMARTEAKAALFDPLAV